MNFSSNGCSAEAVVLFILLPVVYLRAVIMECMLQVCIARLPLSGIVLRRQQAVELNFVSRKIIYGMTWHKGCNTKSLGDIIIRVSRVEYLPLGELLLIVFTVLCNREHSEWWLLSRQHQRHVSYRLSKRSSKGGQRKSLVCFSTDLSTNSFGLRKYSRRLNCTVDSTVASATEGIFRAELCSFCLYILCISLSPSRVESFSSDYD